MGGKHKQKVKKKKRRNVNRKPAEDGLKKEGPINYAMRKDKERSALLGIKKGRA